MIPCEADLYRTKEKEGFWRSVSQEAEPLIVQSFNGPFTAALDGKSNFNRSIRQAQ